MLGEPRQRVERRDMTVETVAACLEVSGVAVVGAPGAAAVAPGAGCGAAPATVKVPFGGVLKHPPAMEGNMQSNKVP